MPVSGTVFRRALETTRVLVAQTHEGDQGFDDPIRVFFISFARLADGGPDTG